MKKRYKSFSGRLTRSVVLTVLVTMTIISVFVFLLAASGIYMLTKTHFADLTDKTNGSIAMMMSKVEVSAENIMDELAWHLSSPELVSSTLEYELNTNRHLFGCGIGFVPGYFPEEGRWFEPYAVFEGDRVTCKWIGSEKHDYLHAEWFLEGIQSPDGIWSNPYLDADGAGTILCTFARQVREPGGQVVGVFGADISLEGLSALIEELDRKENDESDPAILWTGEESHIYSFIIGPDGKYIVHPDKERILKGTFFDYADSKERADYRKLGEEMLAGHRGNELVTMDGIRSIVFYAPLQHSGWSMGIAVPVDVITAPGYAYGFTILFLILIGLLIVFLISRYRIKKATSPLIRLAASAEEVAEGHFDTKLPDIRTQDEIRLLRDSFDHMQKSLSNYIQVLTETTAQKASMENELAVARNIQMSMLPMTWPAFPDRPDLDIYGSVTPARAVGGDLFDFLIRNGKLFFCIGDVSGKGIPASLVMSVVSSLFRTLSESEDSPSRIVTSLNTALSARNESLMFVTLFVGALDLVTGELLYTNAGHNAPIVIRDGHPVLLEADANVPLGVVGDWDYSLQRTALPPGSVLFLYTDGLTEATREGGELFGEERVLEVLSAHGNILTSREFVTQMTEAVSAFVGDSEQSDDLTMMVVKLSRG